MLVMQRAIPGLVTLPSIVIPPVAPVLFPGSSPTNSVLLLTGDEDRLRCHFPAAGVACLERNGIGIWVLHWLLGPEQCGGGKR